MFLRAEDLDPTGDALRKLSSELSPSVVGCERRIDDPFAVYED